MNRRRGLIIVVGAVLAFSAMVVLVGTGISSRRRQRDLRFGAERISALLREDRTAEAAEWFAQIATSVRREREAVPLVELSLQIHDREPGNESLAMGMVALTDRIPESRLILHATTLVLVDSAHPSLALETLTRSQAPEIDIPLAFAQIAAGAEGDDREESGWPQRLVGLSEESPSSEFSFAFERTGEPRYAENAALAELRHGKSSSAMEIINDAGIDQISLPLSAGVLLDRGAFDRARALLERSEPSNIQQALLADALMFSGRPGRARPVHENLARVPAFADIALINLLWIDSDHDPSRRIAELQRTYPSSWQIARAAAYIDPSTNAELLSDWGGTEHHEEAVALSLMLDETPDRRGFAALIWKSLAEHSGDRLERFAGWYFYSRRMFTDLETLLATVNGSASWVAGYRGLLAAEREEWDAAHEAFRTAHAISPDWWTANNLAISWHQVGEAQYGRELLIEAVEFATDSSDRRSVRTLVNAASASPDAGRRRELAERALARDAENAEAALILRQLELGGVR